MRELAEAYYKRIEDLLNAIRVTDKKGRQIDLYEGIANTASLIKEKTASGSKLIFIGNGASAAFSSHMATDFWKNGRMRAIAFNDASLLTCLGNDYGYQHIFEKSIEMFADRGDILVAISSSGRSENILRGVEAAREKGCGIITLSGFEPDNLLSLLGDFNFYVPEKSYGPVEIIHQSILHCILDVIMQEREK
jgi:D-sedoheptulose 7-phosphate isomerase